MGISAGANVVSGLISEKLSSALTGLASELVKSNRTAPDSVRDNYISTHGTGSHAEIYTVNQALTSNSETSVDAILLQIGPNCYLTSNSFGGANDRFEYSLGRRSP